MNRIGSIVGALLLFGLAAFAQTERKPEVEPKTMIPLPQQTPPAPTPPPPMLRYPECVTLRANLGPIYPYLFKNLDSEPNDKKFWDTISEFYPPARDAAANCLKAVSQAHDESALVGAYASAFALEGLRGEALKWLLKQLSQQDEKLRKETSAYIEQNQRYQEAEQKYVGILELYARQAQQQQTFLQTLLLLRALSPPPAPRVYIQQPAHAPVVNLGIHCTVQPTITGQTFINCY